MTHKKSEGINDIARRISHLLRTAVSTISTSSFGHIVTTRDWIPPEGWTEDQLRGVWSTFSIEGSPRGMLDPYFSEAYGRLLITWNLIKNMSGKALELGSNPFFMTWLIQEFTELELSQANYFGERGIRTQLLEWKQRDGREMQSDMSMSLFNMEEDKFPFEDHSLDVVTFCEVIEHLLMDPLHTLREIHRILNPGGSLILTTPNVGRLQNVLAMVEGTNVYDPYSGFGPYGRHNREYTPHELSRLLDFAGFNVQVLFTADAHVWDRSRTSKLEQGLARFLSPRLPDLGQYIFCVAVPNHPPQEGWPNTFFRSRPANELVPWR